MSFLWSNSPLYIDPDIEKRSILDNLNFSRLDRIRVAAREAWQDTPENLLINIGKVNYEKHLNETKLSKEEFEEKYQVEGIEYDPNMTDELAQYLIKRKQQQRINEYIISKGKGGLTEAVGIFGAGVVASLLSPINIAATFVPYVGEARWAYLGAKYGKLAMSAAKGASASAVFQAGFEPIVSYSRHLEQRPYTLAESIENVGIAATFGASFNAMGYGIGRLRDRLITPKQKPSPEYCTGNPVIDNEFKIITDEVLKNTTYPESISLEPSRSAKSVESVGSMSDVVEAAEIIAEDLPNLQKQKLDLYNNYRNKENLQGFFASKEEAASLESSLHQEFMTMGKEEYLPDHLLNALKAKQAKAADLKEKVAYCSDYQEYLVLKEKIDNKIRERIKYEQQQTNAYDLSPEDFLIAKTQLENGKHIDLADPANAKSIYESGYEQMAFAGVLDEPNFNPAELNNPPNILDKATNFINSHKSKKLGFKEFLRQTELRQQAIANEHIIGFAHDLDKARVSHFFNSKEFEADIARELYNITAKQQTPGFTNSPNALKIAKIIHNRQSLALERANRAGASISELDGYITRQSHSPRIIRKMGYTAWRDFIVPLLDLERTKTTNLKAAFEGIVTGLHFESVDYYLPNIPGSGSGNLAAALSQSRTLHFKSADAWLSYNKQCGLYKLSDSVLLSLDKIGSATGMLEVMGNNPRNTFEQLKSRALQDLRETAAHIDAHNDPSISNLALKEIEYFKGSKANSIFDIMAGHNLPENPTLAVISSSIRAFKSMSSLGSVLISSFPDIVTFAAELSNNGIPILQGYRTALTTITATMSSKEKRNFAKYLGIAADFTLGLAYSRLNPDYPALGWVSKLSTLFFKVNCMNWWDSSFKSAMGLVLSNHLADQAHLNFTKLPKLLQQQLSRYGIDQSNWHLYKHLKQTKDGRSYLIPDNSLIPEEAITAHLEKSEKLTKDIIKPTPENLQIIKQQIQQTREDLTGNLRRYYLDRVDTSTPTPHAAEKAAIFLGTTPGTPIGEAVRFFMQFKSFPVTYVMRPLHDATLGRIPITQRTGSFAKDMSLSLKYPDNLAAMSHLFMGSTVMGYMSICSKNLTEGKEIPDPADLNTWIAAAVKGGGLGIYGDFIFGEYDRYGRTFLQEAGGPIFAETNSLASIITKYKQGKVSKAEDEAWKMFKRNVPGRNLFYLLPVLRYYNIQ